MLTRLKNLVEGNAKEHLIAWAWSTPLIGLFLGMPMYAYLIDLFPYITEHTLVGMLTGIGCLIIPMLVLMLIVHIISSICTGMFSSSK